MATIPIIHKSDIVLEEVPIGRGGFGTVYRGKHKWFGFVAVKTLIDNGLLPQRQTKALQAEAKKLLEICHHPNILNIYGLIMEKDNYSLVLEYMPLGSLTEFRKEFTVRWPLMVQILKDVIAGMEFLHTKEPPVYHLDLKADNVLLEGGVHAKLCDFGLSEWKTVTVNVNRNMDKSGRRCTTSHLPPEVWANVNRAPDAYYDLYSFGIVIWEMLSGAVPYGSQSDDIIRSAVLSGQRPDFTMFPKDTPPKLSSMMTRCWHQKPAQRPTFSTLKTEIEKIFSEEYERQLISSLKQLRQEIVQNYESTDPIWTSTAPIETLQEPVIAEPEPAPEPEVSTSPGSPDQSAATSTANKRPSPQSGAADDDLTLEVKAFKLDKDLKPFERQIRKIIKDPVAMRLAKSKYIRDIFNISEETQKILNDSKKLNKIIESDTSLTWELYFSKINIPYNLSGIHLEQANHRAKTFTEVNKTESWNSSSTSLFQSSLSDNYGGYGYSYSSRQNERTEREKRRDRVDVSMRRHPHMRDLTNGGNYYKLKKALENPHHLKTAMKEKKSGGGGNSLSSLKLSTVDPEIVETAKDPLLLLAILREKDDIMRNMSESYPELLCELLSNARRKFSLPSGGYVDPHRGRMRDMMHPAMEREMMMMGMMDPDDMMMMREMEMRRRMRRHPDDDDSDEDDYPGMMGMGMHRKMRMMRDMRPPKMDPMMKSMNRPMSATNEPDIDRPGSSKNESKEEKSSGIMGMLKKSIFGGSEKKKDGSEKKKDKSEKISKKSDDKPQIPSSTATKPSPTPSTTSSSSSSSTGSTAKPDTEATKSTTSAATSSTSTASTSATSTTTTATTSKVQSKSEPTSNITATASKVQSKSEPTSNITVSKSVDVDMTTPKMIDDDDLEMDTRPSMEPMDTTPSISRQGQPIATPSGGQQGGQPTPSGSSQQQSKGKSPQVCSRPISDNNTTPPPHSEPKKAKTTQMETDAKPETSPSAPAAASALRPGTDQQIEHHHDDGAKTFMTWEAGAKHKPNVQIGNRNMMVISDDLDDDPWSAGPMPQRKPKEKKKKEVNLTKSNRVVNQSEMDELALGLGRDWKKLRRYLNIPDPIMEQIELDYQREGQHEIVYQLLRKWKEMKGSMASVSSLADYLHKIGRTDLAQKLK